MEKEELSLGGFDAILDNFVPKTPEDTFKTDDVQEPLDDDDLESIKKNSVEPVLKNKEINKEKDTEEDDTEEEEDIVEEPKVKTTKKEKKADEKLEDNADVDDTEDIDTNNDDDSESTVVSDFFDAISEKLGWEFGEDEEKPKDVESLIDYFTKTIEEESKPAYYSEEVEALDNFVKQGGDIKKYLTIDSEIDLDNLDMDEEDNQKAIVKKLLKEKGFSDKQIEKKVSKYEDAGLLEDEAQDALEDLKEINEQKKEQLLKEQKKQHEQQLQIQQSFYNGVVDEIKGLNNIRGIAVPEKDKKVLIDYILKPDTDGRTKYQKDYAKSGVKGLIESAYFTMNADKLLAAAKREGNNSAVDRFKHSLKNTSISTKSKKQLGRSDDSIWSSMTRQLRIS